MNLRSSTAILGLHPSLVTAASAAIRALALQGMEVLIISGLRTAAQQEALYAQGRTAAGHVVTNARAGQSMHNYGMAIDVVPYLTAGNDQDLNWKSQTPQFQAMVAAFKAQGLEWGGDWKGSLGDFDHFQLGRLPASPSPKMLADYDNYIVKLGSFQMIWSRASNNLYAPVIA